MMEGIDTNWCLTCERYLEHSGPYCSRECSNPQQTTHVPSVNSLPQSIPTHKSLSHREVTRASPRYTPSSSFLEDSASEYSYRSQGSKGSSRSDWIGKGATGIYAWARDVPAGPPPHAVAVAGISSSVTSTHSSDADRLRPPLLSSPSQRRPAPPKLFLPTTNSGKMHPAAPQASRPIITPHTSLPSLTTHSATASLTSIVTPVSLAHASHPCSARSSLYISSKPASEHGDIEKDDHPSAETHRPTLVSKFAAHIKSWAAGERNALVNHPPYSSAHVFNPRSRTVIRAQPAPQRSPTAATVKEADSAVEHCLAEATSAMETVRFGRQSKVTSPASLFPEHSDVLALRSEHVSSPAASPAATKAKPRARRTAASGWVESTEQMRRAREESQQAEERAKHLSPAERETLTREEHPAFRTRGRRAERAVC